MRMPDMCQNTLKHKHTAIVKNSDFAKLAYSHGMTDTIAGSCWFFY